MADLYYYKDKLNEHYLIDRNLEDHSLIELTNEEKEILIDHRNYKRNSKKYIGVLTAGFADQPSLFPEIQDSEFHRESFVDLTKKYHELVCNEGDVCIVYEKKMPFMTIMPGIIAGQGYNTLKFLDDGILKDADPDGGYSFKYGFEVNLYPDQFMKPLMIKLTLIRDRIKYFGDYQYDFGISTEIYQFDLLLEQTSAGFSAGYRYPQGRLQPFIMPGIAYNRGTIEINSVEFTVFENNLEQYTELDEYLISNISATLKTGLDYYLGNRLALSTSMNSELTKSRIPKMKNNRILFHRLFLSAGIFYKI